jgi:leucyl aminopeptidase
MKIRIRQEALAGVETPLAVVPVFEGPDLGASPTASEVDGLVGRALRSAMASGDFSGRMGTGLLVYGDPAEASPARVLFLGVGAAASLDREGVREYAGAAVRRAEALRIEGLHLVVPQISDEAGGVHGAFQAAAEALVLAAHDFRELKSLPSPDSTEPGPAPLVADASLAPDRVGEALLGTDADPLAEAVAVGLAFGEGTNLARTLQSRPGNVATPRHLEAVTLQLAEAYGFGVRILGPKELEKERMGALLAVSAGSDEEPRLLVLEHLKGPKGEAPVALVGKGLTFDAGGISIKPAPGMEEMKYDMSGGAAVLGAMKAIGMLDLPISVVAVVPSSENLLNGRATKPGDVIRARSGKTIEVLNTDAEGRLILADALDYTRSHYSPAAMVDCATLTGACVIALGAHASAVLGTDEALIGALREAGDRAGERCWPLPLWAPYRKQIESPIADLKNIGGRPAGTITAAAFLREFVGDTPWAHLDIAGTAYGDEARGYLRKGAFGVPTRLLLEWVRSRVAMQGAH